MSGGNNEKTNLQVVQGICELLDKMQPHQRGGSYRELITYVKDRPGHAAAMLLILLN